ncbi:MAG: hypothetical protein ACTS4U_00315 [Candidatus Hodgkinia cicadicola]
MAWSATQICFCGFKSTPQTRKRTLTPILPPENLPKLRQDSTKVAFIAKSSERKRNSTTCAPALVNLLRRLGKMFFEGKVIISPARAASSG